MTLLVAAVASYYLATSHPVGPLTRNDCEMLSQGTIGCVWRPRARRARLPAEAVCPPYWKCNGTAKTNAANCECWKRY